MIARYAVVQRAELTALSLHDPPHIYAVGLANCGAIYEAGSYDIGNGSGFLGPIRTDSTAVADRGLCPSTVQTLAHRTLAGCRAASAHQRQVHLVDDLDD